MRFKSTMARLLVFVLFTLGLIGCKQPAKTPQLLNPESTLTELLGSGIVALQIDKSDRTLTILEDDKALKSYAMVLGANPVEDKRREGDRCTPEGTFHVRDLYPHEKWSKFIWIDYPTKESWEKFNTSKSQKEIPQDATIGGEIGIHGVPKGRDDLIDKRIDWTWGCISLKTADVNEIYAAVKVGTRVDIRP